MRIRYRTILEGFTRKFKRGGEDGRSAIGVRRIMKRINTQAGRTGEKKST